ncbi:unnamed protein product, partial [Heterotrigona itama]
TNQRNNDNSRGTRSKRGSIFAAAVTTLREESRGACWSGANQALWSLGSPLTTPLPAMRCPSVSSLRYPATIPPADNGNRENVARRRN